MVPENNAGYGKSLGRRLMLIAACLMLLVAGCSVQRDADAVSEAKTIAMIVKMEQGDYWKTVRMGAEVAAKEFGVKLVYAGPEDETRIDDQIQLVEQAIKERVDALVLAASDYMKLGRVTDAAGNAGIPVIAIDTGVASTKVKSYIGTDNYKAGYRAGMELIEQIGDNSRVAVVSFVEGAHNASQREEGLLDLIAQYSGVRVVDKRYSRSDLYTAERVTEEILRAHPDLDGIVALNSIATTGVMNVVEEKGLGGKVKVIGFDTSTDIMEMVQEGVVQSTIVQNSFTMGYLGVKLAVEAAQGMTLPERVDSGSVVIDAENMLYEQHQKLAFPFVK